VDYEEGHPIRDGLMERVVKELRKICDRPVVYNPALTHQVDIPDEVLDMETDMVRTEYIKAARSTVESWDVVYIILSNNDYVIDWA
jgi:hypothetical protein